MFYSFSITVPANTAKASPVTQQLKLTAGIIHRVEVGFPIGTRALVHCQLFHGGYQLLPTNPGGSFHWDGYTIVIDEHYAIGPGGNILTAKCWSTADTYSYDIVVRIGVLPAEVLSPLSGIGGALRRFLKLVGVGG